MSKSDIRVFHYKGMASDKIWAIWNSVSPIGNYIVFYGRRGTMLNTKDVSADQTADSRISEKLDKGYVELTDKTIDVGTRRVVDVDRPQLAKLIPSSIWYRINDPSRFGELIQRLDQIEHCLNEEWADEAHILRSLSLYQDLKQENTSGSHKLGEGPLGVLLLFSLRRFFNEVTRSSDKPDVIGLADDFTNMLPERFDDLDDYIADSCGTHLVHLGYISKQEHEEQLVQVKDVASDHGLEHYTCIKSIKRLATLVGCIDAPIDLSVIRPDQVTAFF